MECRFLYNKNDKNLSIKLVGDIKYSYSNNFSNFIDCVFSSIENHEILIDLTETKYIDSTNLGLLAKIARLQRRKNNKKVTIICNQPNIINILESMGFDMVFILVKNIAVDYNECKEIQAIPDLNDRETAKLMLEAHKELAELNENNRQTFKDVINFLEDDLSR